MILFKIYIYRFKDQFILYLRYIKYIFYFSFLKAKVACS